MTPHRLDGADALEVCSAAVSLPRPAIVIFVKDTWDVPEVSLLSGAGASDFMRLPLDRDELDTRPCTRERRGGAGARAWHEVGN